MLSVPRARPPMRRGLKRAIEMAAAAEARAARAAPYEKGTETSFGAGDGVPRGRPRARPPMRRGLKRHFANWTGCAYGRPRARPPMRRGLKLVNVSHHKSLPSPPRARPPMRRGLKPKKSSTLRNNW